MFDNPPNVSKVFSIWLREFYKVARAQGWNGEPILDNGEIVETWKELRDLFIVGMTPSGAWVHVVTPFDGFAPF
jgi:hypothetical protein